MDVCLLCLEQRNNKEDVIEVESRKWQEENIQKLIETHFWSMKSITCSSWLCGTCWRIISEFHKFYVRIEDAHVYFTSMFKIEIQDSVEDVGNEMGNACTSQQYELELPMDQIQATPSYNDDEKSVVIKTEIQEDEPDKLDQEIGDPTNVAAAQKPTGETKTTKKPIDRTHICDICGKDFAYPSVLQRHKLIHLPDEVKKVSCGQCGKNFGDINLLSNHIRSVHLNIYALVCDICGRRMRSKDVFERHMLEHEGLPTPTVSCDVCGLKMSNRRCLKRHIEIQHPEGGRIEYKCHVCSKVSPTLKAHKKHVQYKHELGYNFKCTICDKAFKRSISLTEHMARHTGIALYTCPYCPKTFKSNGNMHNHRKKSHPKEWEEACREKYSGNLPPNYKPATKALQGS